MISARNVSALDRFVTVGGPSISPYTNWAQAAASIQSAVNASTAGDTIWVSNGVYSLGATIHLNKRVTVRSVNGREMTRIHGNDSVRSVVISNGATMAGFTITGGRDIIGAGVLVATGTLENCIVKNNTAYDPGLMMSRGGGGVSVERGTVRNCLIVSNYAEIGGGGVDMYNGGLVERSVISYNGSPFAGGINMSSEGNTVILRNCLIAHNSANSVAGVFANGAGCRIQFCTITSNTANNTGGISAFNSPTIASSIIYGNTALSVSNIEPSAWASVSFSCTAPLQNGSTNIDSNPQLIRDADGSYRLRTSSPCIDAGNAIAGVTNDIEGLPRSVDGNQDGTATPDMGCHEYWAVMSPIMDTNGIAIRWMGATNTKYRIMASQDVQSPMSVLATGISGRIPTTSYAIPPTEMMGYYAVGVEP